MGGGGGGSVERRINTTPEKVAPFAFNLYDEPVYYIGTRYLGFLSRVGNGIGPPIKRCEYKVPIL